MKSDTNNLAATVWDEVWVRFRMALTQAGVEPRVHAFCRGWVLGFIGFIKPKKFRGAKEEDFCNFLSILALEGKAEGQIR